MTAGRKKIEPSCGSFINSYMWGVRPLSSFLCCGAGGTRPASCPGPRRAFGHHGAERYGRRLLPSHTCLPSCTLHTVGGPQGNASWLSAKRYHSLDYLHSALLPDALAYVSHSISFHREPAQRSRDACKAFSDD